MQISYDMTGLSFSQNVILLHELQSELGGFLGDGLYLLQPSAVIAVPAVSVHPRELHTLCLGDGQGQSERLRFRVQDTSCSKAPTPNQHVLNSHNWVACDGQRPGRPTCLPRLLPQSSFIQTCHSRPSLSGLFLSCSRASEWSNKTWKRSSLSDRAAQRSTYQHKQIHRAELVQQSSEIKPNENVLKGN